MSHRKKRQKKSPEPRIRADSGHHNHIREKFRGRGGLFQKSPGVSHFSLLIQSPVIKEILNGHAGEVLHDAAFKPLPEGEGKADAGATADAADGGVKILQAGDGSEPSVRRTIS